ncbi:hypothetical protein [Halochromatium sp.]
MSNGPEWIKELNAKRNEINDVAGGDREAEYPDDHSTHGVFVEGTQPLRISPVIAT